MTASLFKSTGLFSVLWPILITQLSGWSTLILLLFSSPFIHPLVTVPSASVTIGITVTFMFYSFSRSLARSRYLFHLSLSFSFTLWSAGTAKSTIQQFPFSFFIYLFFTIAWSARLSEIR